MLNVEWHVNESDVCCQLLRSEKSSRGRKAHLSYAEGDQICCDPEHIILRTCLDTVLTVRAATERSPCARTRPRFLFKQSHGQVSTRGKQITIVETELAADCADHVTTQLA